MRKRSLRLFYKVSILFVLVWLTFVFLDRYAWDEQHWIPVFIVGGAYLLLLILFLFLGPSKAMYVSVTARAEPFHSTTYGTEDSK